MGRSEMLFETCGQSRSTWWWCFTLFWECLCCHRDSVSAVTLLVNRFSHQHVFGHTTLASPWDHVLCQEGTDTNIHSLVAENWQIALRAWIIFVIESGFKPCHQTWRGSEILCVWSGPDTQQLVWCVWSVIIECCLQKMISSKLESPDNNWIVRQKKKVTSGTSVYLSLFITREMFLGGGDLLLHFGCPW